MHDANALLASPIDQWRHRMGERVAAPRGPSAPVFVPQVADDQGGLPGVQVDGLFDDFIAKAQGAKP